MRPGTGSTKPKVYYLVNVLLQPVGSLRNVNVFVHINKFCVHTDNNNTCASNLSTQKQRYELAEHIHPHAPSMEYTLKDYTKQIEEHYTWAFAIGFSSKISLVNVIMKRRRRWLLPVPLRVLFLLVYSLIMWPMVRTLSRNMIPWACTMKKYVLTETKKERECV